MVLGYTLAFRSAGPFIGDLSAVGLRGISPFENVGVPEMAFVAFLATFAAITPALISGAVADRMKFSAWAIFVPVWSLLVYVPVTYWVANPEGWLKVRGSSAHATGRSGSRPVGIVNCPLIIISARNIPSPFHDISALVIGSEPVRSFGGNKVSCSAGIAGIPGDGVNVVAAAVRISAVRIGRHGGEHPFAFRG